MDKENKLVGIITNRDMRFIASEDYDTLKVKDVMTKENLVTGPSNISKDDAHRLLAQHKVEKLPLVDEEGHLTGLITVKDFVKTEQYPDATRMSRVVCAWRRRRLPRRRLAACLRSDGGWRGRARGRHRQR